MNRNRAPSHVSSVAKSATRSSVLSRQLQDSAMKSHDNGAPKEINNWKVYGLATVACMAAVMIGYDVSRPSCSALLPEA